MIESKVRSMHKKIPIIIISVVAVVLVVGIFMFWGGGEGIKNISMDDDVSDKIEGVEVEILKEGAGDEIKFATGDEAIINIRTLLENGDEVDKQTDFIFEFGSGNFLEIWSLGVDGMRIGEVRRLIAQPHRAFGESGIPTLVPPNSTVIFEIELVRIERIEGGN